MNLPRLLYTAKLTARRPSWLETTKESAAPETFHRERTPSPTLPDTPHSAVTHKSRVSSRLLRACRNELAPYNRCMALERPIFRPPAEYLLPPPYMYRQSRDEGLTAPHHLHLLTILDLQKHVSEDWHRWAIRPPLIGNERPCLDRAELSMSRLSLDEHSFLVPVLVCPFLNAVPTYVCKAQERAVRLPLRWKSRLRLLWPSVANNHHKSGDRAPLQALSRDEINTLSCK